MAMFTVQELESEAEGFEDALVGAYMAGHPLSWVDDLSSAAVIQHVAECVSCSIAFKVRKNLLMELVAINRRRRLIRMVTRHLVDTQTAAPEDARVFAEKYVRSNDVGEALIAIAEERGWQDVVDAWNGR